MAGEPVTGDDRAILLALLRRVGLRAPGVAELVERDGPQAALDASLGGSERLFGDDAAPLIERAHAELAAWRRRGLQVLTVLDADYPEQLRAVHDRPALLFLAGDTQLLHDHRPVAVVGTRRPSPDGRAAAEELGSQLTQAGHLVVSGLAAGIDVTAHRAALTAPGRTLAVIGTGHDHAYPPAHAELQAVLAAEHAVVSPFWPETGPSADGFRRRNGVMSGLTLGTVIVEASHRSGTRVQARLALAHGRPVLLRETLLGQSWARELTTRPGVHVVRDATDVIAVLERLHTDGLSDAAPPAAGAPESAR